MTHSSTYEQFKLFQKDAEAKKEQAERILASVKNFGPDDSRIETTIRMGSAMKLEAEADLELCAKFFSRYNAAENA